MGSLKVADILRQAAQDFADNMVRFDYIVTVECASNFVNLDN